MTMRAVGGLCLVAMAALALEADAPYAALVAGVGAAPLLLGLLGRVRQPREEAAEPDRRAPAPPRAREPERASQERRAA
jgi:hypothetical protein